MTICGFYMDESGNTGINDPAQPVLCYTGILVPKEKMVSIDSELIKIIEGTKGEIKAKVLGVPSKEFETIPFFKEFELHGKELIDGDGFYSKIDFKSRIKIFADIFSIVKAQDIKIISSVTSKKLYLQNGGTNGHKMHEMGLSQLIDLVNLNLTQENQHAFVIADNGKPFELDMLHKLLQVQQGDYRLFPDLQVKKSHESPMVQVADLICFVTAIYFRNMYGVKTRKNNNTIVQLYSDHLATHAQYWEYK